MKPVRTAAVVELDPEQNLNSLLTERLGRDPAAPIVEVQKNGTWCPVSIEEFHTTVVGIAKGLMASGIGPGDRVAIMSATRVEWAIVDFAIWAAGAISVPIYESASVDQVNWICTDSTINGAFVELDDQQDSVAQASQDVSVAGHIWKMTDDGFDALIAAGAEISDAELEERRNLAVASDIATIIYTSGTTGRPKGVELTHENFVYQCLTTRDEVGQVCTVPDARFLMFMPMAHIFARVMHILAIGATSVTGHSPDTKNLVADMQSFHPTFIVAVPRVFEKVYNAAEQSAGGGLKLKIFRWAAKVAIVYSRQMDRPSGPSKQLTLQHKLAGKLVYGKLVETLGGNLKFAISAGAPLGDRLGHFYQGIGLTVLEGYGLTETTAQVVVNRVGAVRIGTVGPPMPDTEIRIAPNGEIQVKGPQVFHGYHNNPDATAEAFDGEFFCTGDIGSFDEDDYLSITGRIKEIIVTASGKNVAPALLEDRLRGHPLVSQCVVVGDHKPFIAALVTLDAAMLPGWLANHGFGELSVEQARTDPEVLAALQRAVERANLVVSRSESVRKISVLGIDFTEENGFLTPSLKVRRTQVLEAFEADIDKLYTEDTRVQG